MISSTIFRGFFGNSFKSSGEDIVKRWHNVGVTRTETNAAHTFHVVRNAWIIGKVLYFCGYEVNESVVFETGICHDIEEKETGDSPRNFKQGLEPRMRKMFKKVELEKACEEIYRHFPVGLSDLLQERRIIYQEQKIIEAQIVKVADCLSSVSFLEDEILAMNNSSVSEEFIDNLRGIIRLAEQYSWLEHIWLLIFGQSLADFRNAVSEINVVESGLI